MTDFQEIMLAKAKIMTTIFMKNNLEGESLAKALFDSEPVACEASKKDGLIKNALRKTGFGALKTKYQPVVEQRKCIRCTLQQEQAKNIQPYFV